MGVLVGDQRAIGRVGPVDAGLVARLPEHRVAAEEGQVDPRVTRCLHVGALVGRVVLVVAAGDEQPVIAQQRGPALGVDLAEVADVVAAAL